MFQQWRAHHHSFLGPWTGSAELLPHMPFLKKPHLHFKIGEEKLLHILESTSLYLQCLSNSAFTEHHSDTGIVLDEHTHSLTHSLYKRFCPLEVKVPLLYIFCWRQQTSKVCVLKYNDECNKKIMLQDVIPNKICSLIKQSDKKICIFSFLSFQISENSGCPYIKSLSIYLLNSFLTKKIQ